MLRRYTNRNSKAPTLAQMFAAAIFVPSALLMLLLAAPIFAAPPGLPTYTPEQERQAMIQALQKRLPGTGPADWSNGGAAYEPTVTAVPLNADNATNLADILAIGKKRWQQKFSNGKTLANCFPNGGRRVAASYP